MNIFFITISVFLIISEGVQGHTDSEFIHAALDETPDRVRVLLQEGANINARNEDGQTALMNACNNGRYETVQFLIENGADVNAKDNAGETSLMFACAFDCSGVGELLIKHGADVNAKDNDGWSALIYAAYNGRGRSVRFLLRKGADHDYAIKYATEKKAFGNITHHYPKSTNFNSGLSVYEYAIDMINVNNTPCQRARSHIEGESNVSFATKILFKSLFYLRICAQTN